MSVINMSVITGAQFPLTGMCTKLVTGNSQRPLTAAEKIGTGFVGGAISGFLCAPMELVMIQQQVCCVRGCSQRLLPSHGERACHSVLVVAY